MNKKIKGIFIIILIILSIITLISCDKEDDNDKNLGFIFAKRGSEYAIAGYEGKDKVVIPNTYNDLPITAISQSAFSRSSVRQIYIGENIKTIEDAAFNQSKNLVYVYISKSVSAIGQNVFTGCDALYEIEVAKDNSRFHSIDGNLYSKDGSTLLAYCTGKGEEELTISESVITLGAYLFYENPYIKELYLPASIEEIGQRCFYGSAIENFTVEQSNPTFSSEDGVLYKENSILYAFPSEKEMDEFIVSKNIETIYDDAFSSCQVNTIIISQGVKTIGDRAFLLSQAVDVSIPASVNSIGIQPFQECNKLENITVSNQNQNYQDIAGVALVTIDGKEMLAYCLGQSSSSYTVSDGIEKIKDAVFYASEHLEEIILPASITQIGINSLKGVRLNTIIFNSNIPPEIEQSSVRASTIFVPDGKADVYKNYNEYWEQHADYIKEISQR